MATDRELLDLLSIAAVTSSVCKTKVSAERIVRDVSCFDDVQERLYFKYNLQGMHWGCHTELTSLMFPVCPAL